MTNIVIHGELGEIFGRRHKFKVHKLLDITKALNSIRPGFKHFLLSKFQEGLNYAFIDPKNPDKKWSDAEELSQALAPEEIHIVPAIFGAGATIFIAAATALQAAASYVGAALVSGGFLANLAIGVIIQGVMSLLFPVEIPKTAAQTAETRLDTSSYIFTSLENNMVQGFPIPLLYGELRVGSNIISTNVVAEDLG